MTRIVTNANTQNFSLYLDDVLNGTRHRIDDFNTDLSKSDGQALVIFQLADSYCALAVEHVIEAIEEQPRVTIPGMLSSIEGVMNYRDGILPIINIRNKLGITQSESQAENYYLVCMHEELELAFGVDQVHSVIRATEEQIERDESILSSYKMQAVKGVFNDGARVVLVLNFEGLLSLSEIQHIGQALQEVHSHA